MQAVLCGNVFDHIIVNFISMKDIFNLRFVWSQFRNRIDEKYLMKLIKIKIERRLKNIFKNNYGQFVNAIFQNKAIISGSFLLQCILDEVWDNSDIDIYVEKKNELYLHNIMKVLAKGNHNYDSMYGSVFRGVISNVENFYLCDDTSCTKEFINRAYENKYNGEWENAAIQPRDVGDWENGDGGNDDWENGDWHNPGHAPNHSTEECGCALTIEKNDHVHQKIQIVTIKTSKDYSLIDHTYNTGFDVCKNRLTYDSKGNMKLYLKNFREAITKTSTFTIENVDDFYYRIEKYSKRGFFFKPRYNKLLYLEYLFLHFRMIHVLHTNFDEGMYLKYGKTECGPSCSVKLLFRNTRHYHICQDDVNFTVVENNDKTFNRVLPLLMSSDENKRKDLRRAAWNCKGLDEYAKIRNKFTNIPINVYNNSMYKYDIQYGLKSDLNLPYRMGYPRRNSLDTFDKMLVNQDKNRKKETQKKAQQNNIMGKKKDYVSIQTKKKSKKQIDWLISSLNKN